MHLLHFYFAALAVMEYRLVQSKTGKLRQTASIEWAKTCTDEPDNAMATYNVRLTKDSNGNTGVDADAYLSRGVIQWTRLAIDVTKCKTLRGQCENYKTLNFKTNVCALMVTPNMPWSSFVSRVSPPVRCPFKSGNYSCRNVKLDRKAFQSFNSLLNNHILKVKLSLFDENDRLHLCVDTGLHFVRERV